MMVHHAQHLATISQGQGHNFDEKSTFSQYGQVAYQTRQIYLNLYPPTKGYFRETCKSQNIKQLLEMSYDDKQRQFM